MATCWEIAAHCLGLRYVFLVQVPNCQFGFSHLGFWSGIFFLIAPFLDRCLFVASLTHISLASLLWDIGKQHSPGWDAAERGVPSGVILFA